MKLIKPITIEELQRTALLSDSAKTWALDNLAYLNTPLKLFGKSIKTKKETILRKPIFYTCNRQTK